MHYTVLSVSTKTGELLKKEFRDCASFLDFEAAINTWLVRLEHKVPHAWSAGLFTEEQIGHLDDQDIRQDVAMEWLHEGRGFACFEEPGKKRYVPQVSKETFVKRVRRPTQPAVAASKPAEVVHEAYHQYMEKLLDGSLTPKLATSNAKPPFAGLLRCSTDAREHDHLVHARFGRVV